MISKQDSIPSKSDSYRAAEDIFYVQFNDISFYIEDDNQENFYHCILKKLFKDIKIEKIFPLGGKDNVIKNCKENIGDKQKIYLVDKDFDDLLEKIEQIQNLFYLKRYSIENYLIDEKSLMEYIISERPALNRQMVKTEFVINEILENILGTLEELIILHFLVQKKCSSLKNISMSYERFVSYANGEFNLKTGQLNWYKQEIIKELTKVDKRIRLNVQLKNAREEVIFHNINDVITNFPGKYILKMTKQVIESTYSLVSRNFNSFCYRIADKSDFQSLKFLKQEVETYINE